MKRAVSFLLFIALTLLLIPFYASAQEIDILPFMGDLNFDGEVNTYDYILVKREILNTVSLNPVQLERADINKSLSVEAFDYILIKRHCLKTYTIDNGTESYTVVPLASNKQDTETMKANTKALQETVDTVSANGGGTVYIPKGTFYFASQGSNRRGNEEYVCMPKDNVHIVGAGRETVLKPVGRSSGGLDMFYFNEYADSGFTNPQYLVNADFRDFVIDSELTKADRYTSAGKGFMINLYKDCDWVNVVVKNTDGTGFGMDCPVNCHIIKCEAYNCGKAATTKNVGASGFGIGTGYCEDETILIDNCYAEGNKKFGVFFEHQGRFCHGKNYKALGMKSFVVSNCTAKNNYIDFGGELAVDVTFKNCTVPADSTSTTGLSLYHHSIRCYAEDMNIEKLFDDAADKDAYYYDAVYWAVNNGLTNGIGDNKFGIDDECANGQALTFLYRIAGYPGELRLTSTGEKIYYENALIWAKKIGINASEDKMSSACTRSDFINYLWIYAGSPECDGEYDDATNWALSNKIIDTVTDTNITRCDAVTILYRYFG